MLTYVCLDTGWKPWGHSIGLGSSSPIAQTHSLQVDRSGPKEEISIRGSFNQHPFLSPGNSTVYKTQFLEQWER